MINTWTTREMSLDLETRSRLDLAKVGVYKYAENCEILFLSYAYDGQPDTLETVNLYKGEKIPEEVIADIKNPKVIKHAFNAQFERVVLSKYLGETLNPDNWYCSMVHSLYLNLPASLDKVSSFLFPKNIDAQKDKRGKALITKYSKPRYKKEIPAGDMNEYIEYNRQDVIVEMHVSSVLNKFAPLPYQEQTNYVVDQIINDKGIYVDTELVNSALKINTELNEKRTAEFTDLTGLSSPRQNVAFAKWLTEQTGVECKSVAKEELKAYLEALPIVPKKVKRAIEIRQEMSKSSIAKYEAINRSICKDGRCHGLFQFYGASRTGRYAGRLVQLQNLPRNNVDNISDWREDVKTGDMEYLSMLTENVPSILSQLIRTTIIAPKGKKLIVCDFHAIEAVLSAWLAGEEWRLEVFRGDGRIYEASAAEMFNVDKDTITTPDGEHGENYALRAKGKVAELALGYGGGVGALKKMGGDKLGLTDEEMTQIVSLWRKRSPKIVKFWEALDLGLRQVVTDVSDSFVYKKGIKLAKKGRFLTITLPSNRKLFYFNPHYIERLTPYGEYKPVLVYEGKNQTTGKWEDIETRGAKIFENIIQAIARDILCNSMLNMEKATHNAVTMHVHDELVIEVDDGWYDLKRMKRTMLDLPDWGKDIPLDCAGFETQFYMKD